MSDYQSQNQQQQNFSQSSAFAAALQRAKQIAAKIQPGGGQQAGNSGGSVKRGYESDDSQSSNKRFSSDYGANSPPSQSALSSAAAQAAAIAARLGQNQHSGAAAPQEAVQRAREVINKMIGGGQNSFNGGGGGGGGGIGPRAGLGMNSHNPSMQEIMIPGARVGLVIGKGGEMIKQLQEKSGAKMVVIQDSPDPQAQKPLRITGDPEKVEHAKQLVLDLLQQKDGASVFEPSETVEVFVPKSAVGVVIGKGGEMIKKISTDSGCKLQFLQNDQEKGDRLCTVSGTHQQVVEGKRMIDELIDSVVRRGGKGSGGGGGGYGESQAMSGGSNGYGAGNGSGSNNYSGQTVAREEYNFTVPVSKCGIIIGRGGDTIKQINQQSGAYCEMDRKISANQTAEKTFTLRGEQHQVDEAKRLIQEKINLELNLNHVGTTYVPADQAYQQQQDPYAQAAAWTGYPATGWDQGQQTGAGAVVAAAAAAVAGAQPGQPDYSQQWIEYYRQMGMHREAEAIEQQVKMRGAQGGQPAAAQPAQQQQQQQQQQQMMQPQANGATAAAAAAGQQQGSADYSAQWAEYYRKVGKIEEAEAIEKQIAATRAAQAAAAAQAGGVPQPYGQPSHVPNTGSAPMPGQMAPNQMQPNPAGPYGQYQQFYQQQGFPGYPGGFPGQGQYQPAASQQDKK